VAQGVEGQQEHFLQLVTEYLELQIQAAVVVEQLVLLQAVQGVQA
jgi:hypothetical protein